MHEAEKKSYFMQNVPLKMQCTKLQFITDIKMKNDKTDPPPIYVKSQRCFQILHFKIILTAQEFHIRGLLETHITFCHLCTVLISVHQL